MTNGFSFVILYKLACGRPQERSEANLENDTEREKRAKERKRTEMCEQTAKIPKSEEDTKVFLKGLNGRV